MAEAIVAKPRKVERLRMVRFVGSGVRGKGEGGRPIGVMKGWRDQVGGGMELGSLGAIHCLRYHLGEIAC
jgi:hypothetical protein